MMRSLDTTDIPGAQSKQFTTRGVSHHTKYQPSTLKSLENANIGYTVNIINKESYSGSGFSNNNNNTNNNNYNNNNNNNNNNNKEENIQSGIQSPERGLGGTDGLGMQQSPSDSTLNKGSNDLSQSQVGQVYQLARGKQSKVIAIADTDFIVRSQVAKFFSSKMISDFQMLTLPGCCLALQDQKSPFRESIFSSIRWIQESFDITDIYVFQSINDQTNFSQSSRNDNQVYNIGLVNRCEIYLKALGTDRIIVRTFLIDDQGRFDQIF